MLIIGTYYGKGVYFARDAHCSHWYASCGIMWMYLTRVLTGEFTASVHGGSNSQVNWNVLFADSADHC